jgi:hypothetical protein
MPRRSNGGNERSIATGRPFRRHAKEYEVSFEKDTDVTSEKPMRFHVEANSLWKDFNCEVLKATGANALKQHARAVPDTPRTLKAERRRQRLTPLRDRPEGGKK